MSVLQARPRALNRFSDGSYVFDFTFRKDALCQVTGLIVGHSDGDRCLTIVVVDPRGPVAAWNSACEAAGRFETVREGDKILQVNDASRPDAMLRECSEGAVLHFTLARAGEKGHSAGAVFARIHDHLRPDGTCF